MTWTIATQQITDDILLLQHSALNFENFTTLAPQLIDQIGARVCEQNWGADQHAWVLEYENINLLLEFEDYTASVWLAVTREQDVAILAGLARQLDCQVVR
ncbi:MAG: hypothetical protein ACI86X_001524 [Moritella sp.]|jgi:hypothetical protein